MSSSRPVFLLVILIVCGFSEATEEKALQPEKLQESLSLMPGSDNLFQGDIELKKRAPGSKGSDSLDCGEYNLELNEAVIIESPNYPNKYPKNYQCNWAFTCWAEDSVISVSCKELKLAGFRKCTKTYLEFSNENMKKTYCGMKPEGVDVVGNTGYMAIEFKTSRRRRKGFQCTVTAIERPPTTTTIEPPCYCGQKYKVGKIVGGTETEKNEYPWQVGLVYNGGSMSFCGGSIISDQWILTAAHCIDDWYDFQVVVGEHQWSTDSETSATERINVVQTIRHSNYNYASLNNDIALIKLATPLSFGTKIAPVCLPPPNELYEDVMATVTGWGTRTQGGYLSDQLYEVDVPTMSNQECAASYPYSLSANMICAGYQQGGKDACQGDSGGPMITAGDNEDTYKILIGIVSWGEGCAQPDNPGVYTRVNNYLNWIEANAPGFSTCPPPPA